MLGNFAHAIYPFLATYEFTVLTHGFYGCADFHVTSKEVLTGSLFPSVTHDAFGCLVLSLQKFIYQQLIYYTRKR